MDRAMVAATSGVMGCASILPRLLSDREYRDVYVFQCLSVSLALQLRALRDQRGWSQTDLARRANVGVATVSRLESFDLKRTTVNTLIRVAKAFDVALQVQFASWPEFLTSTSPDEAVRAIAPLPTP